MSLTRTRKRGASDVEKCEESIASKVAPRRTSNRKLLATTTTAADTDLITECTVLLSRPPADSLTPNAASAHQGFYAEDWAATAVADAFEEKDAHVVAEVKQFRVACAALRDILLAAWKDKGNNVCPSAEAQRERCVNVAALFLSLKRLNRQNQFRLKAIRDCTETYKSKADLRHSEIQHLRYEVVHLRAEVERCLSFRSADESVQLLPVEHFLAANPLAASSALCDDPHALQLARLGWELELRMRLAQELAEAESEIAATRVQLSASLRKLNSLLPGLRAIQSTSSELMHNFDHSTATAATAATQDAGVKCDTHLRQLSVLLPAPLFVLFNELLVYTHVSENRLRLDIEGDVEEARHLSANENLTRAEVCDEEKQDFQTAGETHSRHENMFKSHPLEVLLHLGLQKCACSEVHLRCIYFPNLHLVTARISLDATVRDVLSLSGSDLLEPTTLLAHLFADDMGLESHNWHPLRNTGAVQFCETSKVLGLSYGWLQRLAGLRFLQQRTEVGASSPAGRNKDDLAVDCMDSSNSFLADCMARVRRRVVARLVLQAQLRDFEMGACTLSKIQAELPALVSLFPNRPAMTRVINWQRGVFDDFRLLPQAASLLSESLVDLNANCYIAEVNRDVASSQVRGVIHVFIPLNYPCHPALFLFQVNEAHWISASEDRLPLTNVNSLEVKFIEAEVNSYWKELCPLEAGSTAYDYLLLTQMHRLLVCTDAWAEQKCETAVSVRYNRKAKFASRAPALKYVADKDMFVQR